MMTFYKIILAQFVQKLAQHDETVASRVLSDLEACAAVGQFNTPFRLWKNLQISTAPFKSGFIMIDPLNELDEWKDTLALLTRIVDEQGETQTTHFF
jgi:hypothetical protein